MVLGKKITLLITGGIAAYKTPELARRLGDAGFTVTAVLSESARQFVTELALQSVTGNRVYGDLFSLDDEHEMGHIRLARDADLVLVAPATANTIAKMAHGYTDNMVSAILLATTAPVMLAPAMNWAMWENPATRENVATITSRGASMVGPNAGELACGEEGPGRMAEIPEIVSAAIELAGSGPLRGKHCIVTSGPTVEPIDPVRFIANRSSGKQGHAIAAALANLGANVTLVCGPVTEPDPMGVDVVRVETAREMLAAVNAAMPGDVFIGAAAVSDWRPETEKEQKIKKSPGARPDALELVENPDILKSVSTMQNRPMLVIGFGAETENLVENARLKLAAKGCDWILANDVSPASGTFGGDENQVTLISRTNAEQWQRMSKNDLARQLAARIVDYINAGESAGSSSGGVA